MSLLDKYYSISEVFEDDLVKVALALRTCGAKEPVNYLYERLTKVNLEKSSEELEILYRLVTDKETHEGLKQIITIAKTAYLAKDGERKTYTKDDYIT